MSTSLDDPDKQLETAYIWGDLDPLKSPEIQVLWGYSRLNPLEKDYTFKIKILITEGGVVRKLSVLQTVPHTEFLNTTHATPGEVIGATLQEMAQKLSPKLYEQDPRRGLPLSLGEEFPRSPLFDRIGLNPRDHAVRMSSRGRDTFNVCPFCEDVNTPQSIWCGGNVGWSHTKCAPWITPR